MMFKRTFAKWVGMAAILCACAGARAADSKFIYGVDISMLPTIEKSGGVFSDGGKPGDAIQILASHGCNLFRVRLFVKPDPDYRKNFGAVQDLAYVRGLAKRIKATRAMFLLDIHYSDSWADPGKQFTPADWKGLGFEDLKAKVHDYTAGVLSELREAGVEPDAAGWLLPDDAHPATAAVQISAAAVRASRPALSTTARR